MPVPAAVSELICGSGNNFHSKVARWFREDGWEVIVSPYYLDQSQQKARELDLVVEKMWPMKNRFGEFLGNVVVRLFVECKFVPSHSVFWFTDKSRAAIESLLCDAGPFRPNNAYTSKHHYLVGERVAKLFASSSSRGQEAEPFYKALNQALNGLVSLRTQPLRVRRTAMRAPKILATLDYPVVICSSFSELYCADFDGRDEPCAIQDNFQLEVEYAYVSTTGDPRDELFILDFVEYDKLPVFASVLGADAALAGFFAAPDT